MAFRCAGADFTGADFLGVDFAGVDFADAADLAGRVDLAGLRSAGRGAEATRVLGDVDLAETARAEALALAFLPAADPWVVGRADRAAVRAMDLPTAFATVFALTLAAILGRDIRLAAGVLDFTGAFLAGAAREAVFTPVLTAVLRAGRAERFVWAPDAALGAGLRDVLALAGADARGREGFAAVALEALARFTVLLGVFNWVSSPRATTCLGLMSARCR